MPRRKWDHDVHKYNKILFNSKRGGETTIWRCMLTNCQHYLVGEMVLGKLCLCNRCGEIAFEMKKHHLDLKKPHCIACTKAYKGKRTNVSDIVLNLDELLRVE